MKGDDAPSGPRLAKNKKRPHESLEAVYVLLTRRSCPLVVSMPEPVSVPLKVSATAPFARAGTLSVAVGAVLSTSTVVARTDVLPTRSVPVSA